MNAQKALRGEIDPDSFSLDPDTKLVFDQSIAEKESGQSFGI